MKVIYPVVFSRTNDEKDTYLVEIPDINGFTEGYGLADAIEMARDYIAGHCYKLSEEELPAASAIEAIDPAKCEFVDGDNSFVSVIDADLDAYRRKVEKRAVRRNVSIPAWLDQAAEKEHINFSRVLQEALMQKLNQA